MATNVATDNGRMNWSLSSDGILAYWEAAHDLHELVWVSPEGIVAPLDYGRELFYVTDDSTMVAASVETHPSFRVVARRDLFRVEDGLQWSVVGRPSVRADGTFLFMRALERTDARVVLVFGFFEELEQRLRK